MAGYNTICEILALRKQVVVVPRVHPVEEQRIRAERMSKRALFEMILPSDLSALPRVRRLVNFLAQDDGPMDSARVKAAGAGLQ